MNLFSLIISVDPADPYENRSLYYAYISNCLKEYSSLGASICGGRGALNQKSYLYPITSESSSYSRTFIYYPFDKAYMMLSYNNKSKTIYYQTSEDNLYRMGEGDGCVGPKI